MYEIEGMNTPKRKPEFLNGRNYGVIRKMYGVQP